MGIEKPEKASLAWRTADILEGEIRNGRWEGVLPGYRVLCELLGVSPRVVREALDLLTRREVLLPPEGRRPRQINPEHDRTPSGGSKKCLTILSAIPYDRHNENTHHLLEEVYHRMSSAGWDISMEVSREYGDGKVSETLESFARRRGSHRWLLVRPPEAIVRWAMERGLQIICLGGTTGEFSPPFIGLRLKHLLKVALEKLIGLGHQRICVMMAPQTLNMFPVVEFVEKVLREHGVPYREEYNVPRPDKDTPAAFKESLENLFRFTPPTAAVVAESKYLATIYSYCQRQGIIIPDHLSVITTQNVSDQYWLVPEPAHFVIPANPFINPICNWIENYPTRPCRRRFIDPELALGESIAPLTEPGQSGHTEA